MKLFFFPSRTNVTNMLIISASVRLTSVCGMPPFFRSWVKLCNVTCSDLIVSDTHDGPLKRASSLTVMEFAQPCLHVCPHIPLINNNNSPLSPVVPLPLAPLLTEIRGQWCPMCTWCERCCCCRVLVFRPWALTAGWGSGDLFSTLGHTFKKFFTERWG